MVVKRKGRGQGISREYSRIQQWQCVAEEEDKKGGVGEGWGNYQRPMCRACMAHYVEKVQ